MNESERLRLAFHESGHAVAAVALGERIERVWISGDGGSHGMTEVAPREPSRVSVPALLAGICQAAVVSAAGAAGESLWWDSPAGRAMAAAANPELAAAVRSGSSADDDASVAELAGFAAELSGGTGLAEWIGRRRADAAAVVAARARDIAEVAIELAAAGELTGAEVAAVLA